MPENQLYKTLTIASVMQEAPLVKTFVFEKDPGNPLPYQPGQYLTFLHREVQQESRRSYSLISAPVLQEPAAIGVKRVENGLFSRWLFDHAQPGSKLLTIGAGGFFVLPEDLSSIRQVFFLAAGIGITPILSLLKTLLYGHPSIRTVLVYSNHSRADAAYLSQLLLLKEAFPDRFRLELLFSDHPDLYYARLHAELLVSFLNKWSVAGWDQTLFYICGPVNYKRLCIYTLQQQQVPDRNIRKENFHTEVVVHKQQPPDQDTHRVRLLINGAEREIEVHYPDSILQSAQKSGIALPYSCEAGVCGSCAGKCEKGKVWMSYNEVLTPEEVAKGWVLTCVGHPVAGDATIRF